MAWVIEDTVTGSYSSELSKTLTLSLGAPDENDVLLLLAMLSDGASSRTLSVNSGTWVEIAEGENDGDSYHAYYCVAGGSAASSYTVTWANESHGQSWVLARFSGGNGLVSAGPNIGTPLNFNSTFTIPLLSIPDADTFAIGGL